MSDYSKYNPNYDPAVTCGGCGCQHHRCACEYMGRCPGCGKRHEGDCEKLIELRRGLEESRRRYVESLKNDP